MPIVKLPVYSPADSQKGLCYAAKCAGVQSPLIIGCVSLAVISEGRADPLYELPQQIIGGYSKPEEALKTANNIALNIIKNFDIRNMMDWLDVRPVIERLYANVAAWEPVGEHYKEYVRIHDRWYVRTWENFKHKKPTGDFGVLLHLNDGDGNVGISVAVDGTAFRQMKTGGVLYRKTSAKRREKTASLKAFREQGRWKKMLEIYSSIDSYIACDRQQLVINCALEVLETAQHILAMGTATAEQARFNQTNGFDELVEVLELVALQKRHQPLEKRTFTYHATTYGLKDQCKSSDIGPELAAKLTAFYRPDLIKSTKKKTVKSK